MAKSASYSEALHRLVVALNGTGIRYALTGAAAVGYYGIPRTSMDIDVVMRGNLSDAQIETLATALSKNGFTASKKEIHRAVDGSEVKFQAFDDRSGYLRIDMFLEKSFGRVSTRIDGLTLWFRTFEELLAKKIQYGDLEEAKLLLRRRGRFQKDKISRFLNSKQKTELDRLLKQAKAEEDSTLRSL